MQFIFGMPVLVLVWAVYTWMKLPVLAMRPNLLTVPEALLSTVTMATEKMLEYDVKVRQKDIFMVVLSSYISSIYVVQYQNVSYSVYV